MRYPSVDILRTVAIVVMVMVHFPENLSGYTPPFTGLGAPLFTFLSGVSYYLWMRSQQKRGVNEEEISKISIRRGLFVIGVGFAFNVFVWFPEDTFIWDVLTFIGSALLLLNLLRRAPALIPTMIAIASIVIAPAMRASAEYSAYWSNGYYEGDFTLSDLLIGYFATGYFPIFPWIAYSMLGFVAATLLFPRDKSEKPTVWPVVSVGVALLVAALITRLLTPFAPETLTANLLTGWHMFPPSVEYLLVTIGSAFVLFGLLHRYVDNNPNISTDATLFRIVKIFSRYAFTIYILHHMVHLYPLWIYGYIATGEPTIYWGEAMGTTSSLFLGVVFLVCCYAILSRLDPDNRYGIEGWMRWLCG